MQLDSLHSLQDSSILHSDSNHCSNINNNHNDVALASTSTTQDSSPVPSNHHLDCEKNLVVSIEPSLQPLVLDTFILSSNCSSPGSPTPSSASSACSNTSSSSDISSASPLAELLPFDCSLVKNEGTVFKVNSISNASDKESMLFALQNDYEPLDLPKQPCVPLHLHFRLHLQQKLQQQEQERQSQSNQQVEKEQESRDAGLVPNITTTSSPSLTMTILPSEGSESSLVTACSPSCPNPAPSLDSTSIHSNHSFQPSMASTQLENEQSELEFNRDLIISNTNSNNNIIHLNNINKNDPDTMMESPLAAHHPHIIYSTVPAETAIITATDTSAKVIRSSTKTTSSDVTPRSMILDLDRGSTQATGAVETTLLPVQFNSTPLDSTEENITIPSIHDHLRFQGEINFDKPSQDHCLHSQWTDSLSECNYSNTSSIKGDGSRFKDPIESHVRGMGRERKRSTGVTYDGMSSDRKRRKNQPDWGYKHSSSTGLATSTETTVHLLRFLEKRLEQRCPSSITTCSTMKESNKSLVFKKKSALDFDPFLLLKTWSSLESSPKAFPEMRSSTGSLLSSPLSCNKRRIPRHRQPYQNSLICRQQHDVPEKCQCRKRAFADAFEFSQPFTMNAEVACYHPNWIESIKKRKIHQNATKWTSALSPAPYVRLLTLRNFWEMMEPRQDLTWRIIENNTQSEKDDNTEVEEQSQELNESGNISIPSEMEAETEIISIKNMTRQKIVARRNSRSNSVRTVKHVPCPGHFLRGLWEEEIRDQRIRQMIPDTVRKPIRGKIYHAKPIMTIIKQNKPSLLNFLTADTSSSNSATISAEGIAAESKNDSSTVDKKDSICEPSQDTTITSSTELELSLKKKHRAAAIIRSHAITEGSDMSEYKPWKDGTVVPRQGSLQALKASRSNIMDPWPVEEAKSKDMCMRVLHRMREQLNIVINLQIHLRSMMKTAPAQWSFLLSIRHPGQVSIELLLALYGPHFMQTSNFRAIEELLWGAKGHSQQAASSSIEAVAAASSNPALV